MKAVFLDTGTLGPDDIDLHPLTAQLPDLEFFTETSPALVAERISDANIVFVNKVRLTAELLADAPALKLVCLAATGTDNVDLDAARDAGIVVCNIREYCTTSVVQHVFALLLTLTQHLDANRSHVHNGRWKASGQFCVLDNPIRELHGMTLGLVGYGTLGRAVGAAATAFGLEVLAARRPYAVDDRSAPQVQDNVLRAGFGCDDGLETHLRDIAEEHLLVTTIYADLLENAHLVPSTSTSVLRPLLVSQRLTRMLNIDAPGRAGAVLGPAAWVAESRSSRSLAAEQRLD